MGSPRAQMAHHLPEAYTELARLSAVLDGVLDDGLHTLVKLRASVLNGCAFCVDMHTREALEAGTSPQRVALVAAWREAGGHFTEVERAVLAVVDALTRLDGDGLPDEVHDAAAAHLSEREMVALVTAVGLVNLYNRLGIGTGMTPPVR
ncbi:carboxymuconolactone decarboxylase family protein [Nocardiopsis changdeensis]|uniref:Carboxymuconolactone decarboxylase family protein n=1 Tax=Nocardiopsis changdeensis TaxID=2831969 RepID=A0ABX8BHH6_9ACTN|nr:MULTISPECIES: carboxymuconolactone decarboxylase family protein [Nocardiopsis]QUX20482.1 carboxymuconolactone decarboxylase family protein [Nocardiopsis changdeensis]QYX36413.1 carboxymuconolactone decarboxylase family protein [Nocardiopsis sp. MT53]